MNEFLQELKRNIVQKVHQIENSESDILKQSFAIALAFAESNSKLKDYIIAYDFKDEAEEIYFFKNIKPLLVSYLIYHCQLYNIEMNHPVGGVEAQREYLNKELDSIQDYIERRQEFYCYYRLGSTHLDLLYYTRDRAELGQYLETTLSERDPKYSTNCDYKLAKIMANERLEETLKEKLKVLDNRQPENLPTLPWCAKKSFLIEMLYALDSARAFGKIPLSRVVEVVEKVTGIKLGNISSAFATMKTRNDPTPFLDMLKDSLLNRMKRANVRRNKEK